MDHYKDVQTSEFDIAGKHKDNSHLSKEQKQFSGSRDQSNCDFLKNFLQEKELEQRTDSYLNTR